MSAAFFDVELKELKASDWYKTRPQPVRAAIDKYPPNQFYRTATGYNAFIYSYGSDPDGESRTVTLMVTRDWNPHISFSRKVYAVRLEDLVPIPKPIFPPCSLCDLDKCHECEKPRALGSMFCMNCMDEQINFITAMAWKVPK